MLMDTLFACLLEVLGHLETMCKVWFLLLRNLHLS